MRMMKAVILVWLSWLTFSAGSSAAPQDTDIPGVTAEIAFARQYNGVLHVGVLMHNPGTTDASMHTPINFGDVTVVDAKANKKFFPLKDANGHFLAGPISDWNGGGRWFPKLGPQSDTLVWILFDGVTTGDSLTVEGPVIGSFADIPVSTEPPQSAPSVASSVPPLRAAVTSATRAEGQLRVTLKIVNPGSTPIGSHTVSYRDVYALDPYGKRSYPLLKDAQGLFVATPMADKNDGGRWFLSKVGPNGQALITLNFQAPPDSVHRVDIVFPWFGPFEAVIIAGEGGAADSGLAVAGRSTELQRALKELGAEDTPTQVKVNLSADLLFDFDKSDIKPAAGPELQKVVTLLKYYPNSQLAIDGHTDSKGKDAYNKALSERRAATVADWLIKSGGIDRANVHTRGLGATHPVAANANPDGTDNPDGRAKNRRVEITVTKP